MSDQCWRSCCTLSDGKGNNNNSNNNTTHCRMASKIIVVITIIKPSHLASSVGHGFVSHFKRFLETLVRASIRIYIRISPWSLVPRYWNEARRSPYVYARIRYPRPKDPAGQRGGEFCKDWDYPLWTLCGLSINLFYPSYYIAHSIGSINILTFILFFSSLYYQHLSASRSASLPRFFVVSKIFAFFAFFVSVRACFSCHTFFAGTIEKKSRKKKKTILFFSGLLAGSLFAFFHRLVEIYFAHSVMFSVFLLSFRVRVCNRNTATRASPAPSEVSADDAGG